MTEYINNINLNSDAIIALRGISVDGRINSVDIDQTSGRYIVTKPLDGDGYINNEVIIYPPSPQLEINETVTLTNFAGSYFRYPSDAKFDYVRRKIWIADTGNNRVFRADLDTLEQEAEIEAGAYPHAIAVNLNDGGAFIKSYQQYPNICCVYQVNERGTEIARFISDNSIPDIESSSSSSSSESSSSSLDGKPVLPNPKTIAYDHVRSRCWWIFGRRLFMMDERNLQVTAFELGGYSNSIALDIEYSTGNPLVMVKDRAQNIFIIQVSKDNNQILAEAYIEEA